MGCNQSNTNQTEIASQSTKLTDPIQIGSLLLENKSVLAPMTRCRCDPKTSVPNDLMVEYYAQRAGFGLILTECSQVSPLSNAFPGSGGIYSEEQTQGWKKVVDAVHNKGGKIALQIWHAGRSVPSEFIDGQIPIAPSAIAQDETHKITNKPYPVPKAMTAEDIKEVQQQFRTGAENAKKAGFDAIELHGANGYLVDQFLRDGTNKRTDNYGGSIENRCRFMLEVMDILIEVFGADKVGVRLGLTGRFDDMYDSNPLELYEYALKELDNRKIAFVELKRHGNIDGGVKEVKEGDKTTDDKGRELPNVQIKDYFAQLRPLYSGLIIANDGFDPESAQKILDDRQADLVSFGFLGISNPDFSERVKNNQEMNKDVKWQFAFDNKAGKVGYTDYPVFKDYEAELKKKVAEAEKKAEEKIEKAEEKAEQKKEEAEKKVEQKKEEAEKKVEQKEEEAEHKKEEALHKAEEKKEAAEHKAEQKKEEAEKKVEQKKEEAEKKVEQKEEEAEHKKEEALHKAEEKKEAAEHKAEDKLKLKL